MKKGKKNVPLTAYITMREKVDTEKLYSSLNALIRLHMVNDTNYHFIKQ